ncbi:phage portal protein [Rhodococcus jostii]|uniref:phage portal protein n=1 Tax=Rhodococcus jostii TaxID=132919 RepID=UPI00363F831D
MTFFPGTQVTPLPAGGLQIPDLDHTDQNLLDLLWMQFRAKWPRNELRSRYYDHKNAVKSLGIAIPPEALEKVDTVIGWPAKAVDSLARRNNLDGFVIAGGSADDLGIGQMWTENNMDIEAPQAHTSAYKHAVAFVATTAGDTAAGEPEVLITARSANTATGLWNPRLRQLSAVLSLVSFDQGGPTEFVMYLPDRVLMVRRSGKRWRVETVGHTLGRVPVEMLTYRPNLDRPFGSSRISRAVMSMTDEAVRTIVRTEIGAEFFMAPQRYALGVAGFENEDGTTKTAWESVIGHMLAIGRDEDGEIPTFGQFPQMSMQPHIDQLRSIAARFASETSLPISALGIVQDNPASAEAIYAAKEDFIVEAEAANAVFGAAWAKAIRTGVQIREGLDELPPELLKLRAKWRDPATPSRASAAAAVREMVTAFPWMAESEVALEQLGWDQTTIARAMADKRKAGLAALVAKLPPPPPNNPAAATATATGTTATGTTGRERPVIDGDAR